MFLHHGIKSCLLEKSMIFESINCWVSVFDLIPIHIFHSSSWSLFQLYGESLNFSYIEELHPWSLCVKIFLSQFLCCSHCSRITLCQPFYSFLDLLCRPFPGVSSLHYVFGSPCHKISYQFQIHLVFKLPHVGWWKFPWFTLFNGSLPIDVNTSFYGNEI